MSNIIHIFSMLDKYFSNSTDQENEELILHKSCCICNCRLTDDNYDEGVFDDDNGSFHHLACKCKIYSHQQCIDNWVHNVYKCPLCEKRLEKTPFIKTMWIIFERFIYF